MAILAMGLVAHHYLAPAAPRAGSLGQAAVSGYGHPVAAAAADQDDAATVAAMVEAGRMWAGYHKPNSAAGCPACPAAFHAGYADAVSRSR